MIRITIENTRSFIQHLLSNPFFGSMEMVRLELTTSVTRTVDGRIREEFFDTKEERGEYIRWEEERDHFIAAIRGKVLPLSFRIVFRYPAEESEKLIGRGAELTSLFLNVNYDRKSTSLTTGISQNYFPPDPSSGKAWDEFVQHVAQKLDIA